MNHRHALAAAAAGMGLGAGAAIGCYIGLVTGRLTLDLRLGRRVQPLGPLVINISAPRELVFATAAAPYAERRPRAMQEKVRILERTDQMLLAAHRTPVGRRLTAVTVETVSLDPPDRIGFRLVRGPVPHVLETFTFEPTPTEPGSATPASSAPICGGQASSGVTSSRVAGSTPSRAR